MGLRARRPKTDKPSKSVFRPVLSSPFCLDWPQDAFESTDQMKSWAHEQDFQASRGVIGINQCTRVLEQHIRHLRKKVMPSDKDDQKQHQACTEETALQPQECDEANSLLLCRHDVDPAGLTAHIPVLFATLSALRRKLGLRCWQLLVLPRGSETTLAAKMSVRRCAAVLFPRDVLVRSCIKEAHGQPAMTWLDSAMSASIPNASLPEMTSLSPAPPQIKLMRCRAPLDMNAVRAEKRASRKLARERSKVTRRGRPPK
ncbi:hypothetical protein K437DRAFT_258893 [Tilletiaria anomala UBC 951]|uniref:Uncharacterized protein n=1 Tax=Tilletiaria anomala (strain ATCC 24038 / CBS 436.72 / UBC 951) TaxID=1037660 RepID=A0A066VDR2_TILAU|nr:uncharacterized protein K437DRAFT_258893 [Tilletiaria anomala UBC 951]KDN39847.1 hypothetical protein K437DRAFT_258893 [Tilletiaria anomala UBC 951]